MGLYVAVFALKSKKKFYLDREYNLSWFLSIDELCTQESWDLYQKANYHGGVNRQEMLSIVEFAKKGWQTKDRWYDDPERSESRVDLMTRLTTAILACPEDEQFKVVTDVQDDYYSAYEDFEDVDLY